MTETTCRPCPGCENTIIHTYTCVTVEPGKFSPFEYYVTCPRCGAYTKRYDTEAEAIAAWNIKPEGE